MTACLVPVFSLAVSAWPTALAQNTPSSTEVEVPAEATPDSRAWLLPREQRWLETHSVLRHGVLDGHEPFEFVEVDGSPSGLTSDYMKIIGERLGIRFESVPVDSFAELAKQMRDGRLDVSSYLPSSPPWRESLSWSEPVIEIPIAVFGRANSDLVLDIPALEQFRFAVEIPSRAQELLSRDFPALEPVYVDSPVHGLRAVLDGEADYFMHNVFSVEYFQRKAGTEPLRIVMFTPYSFQIRIASSRELEPLIPMIHKVVGSLSDHERTLIFDKWVNLRPESPYNWQRAIAVGSAILTAILGIFASILLWNRRLSLEVDARTQDLEQSKEALRALAFHMERVREEEKSRVAMEMHDELGHSLTALAMGVRRLRQTLKKKLGDTASELDHVLELRNLVREASETSRRIMSDLRPSVLEDLGLVAAIEWLAHEFEAHYGIPCVVNAEDLAIDLHDDALIALFRIAQEALTNVAKHASASLVRVSMQVDDACLTLEIRDDGVGMRQGSESKEGSFGLLGIRERAYALGGQLQVSEDTNGVGTRVWVRIPVQSLIAGSPLPDGGAASRDTT